MKINVSCPIHCSLGVKNYWSGCQMSDTWDVVDNWTSGIPEPLDEVEIPYLQWRPDPKAAIPVTIHELQLRPGAELTLVSGAVFQVE
jgi:hypothetical protein